MIEVTTLYCPKNQWDGKPGEDNTTHHLLPRAKGMVCRDCGKTEKELREAEQARLKA